MFRLFTCVLLGEVKWNEEWLTDVCHTHSVETHWMLKPTVTTAKNSFFFFFGSCLLSNCISLHYFYAF